MPGFNTVIDKCQVLRMYSYSHMYLKIYSYSMYLYILRMSTWQFLIMFKKVGSILGHQWTKPEISRSEDNNMVQYLNRSIINVRRGYKYYIRRLYAKNVSLYITSSFQLEVDGFAKHQLVAVELERVAEQRHWLKINIRVMSRWLPRWGSIKVPNGAICHFRRDILALWNWLIHSVLSKVKL